MENGRASLGCGTLILIALIVLIVGNKGSQEVKTEVHRLQDQTRQLQHSVDLLRDELSEVRRLIEQR